MCTFCNTLPSTPAKKDKMKNIQKYKQTIEQRTYDVRVKMQQYVILLYLNYFFLLELHITSPSS